VALKGFRNRFKPLEILSEAEVEAMHRSTLQVLWETGVNFHDERALKIMAENGCVVDFNSNRVRFPEHIVMEYLAKCPTSFRVKARDSQNDIILSSGGATYFGSSSGFRSIDLDTWEPKNATRKDFYDFIKVLDYLPNVHHISAFPYFGFDGVPQIMRIIEANAAKIRMSSKTQMEGAVADNDLFTIPMAEATGMDLCCLVNPAAPLSFYETQMNGILRYSEMDQPFHFASGPVMGATAPVTIAGGVITPNVEAIAGAVLAQMIKPGARLWFGNYANEQNMRTGSPSNGAIGNALHELVFNQMARKYQIPTWSSSSAWSSSKQIDFQAGYEAGIHAILCALAGPSMVIFQCALTMQLVTHPVKAILDDDIAGMAGRLLEGVEVNDESMAVDLINQVGPIPGMFLDQAHTRKWYRKEQYVPAMADKLPHGEWVAFGSKTALAHARDKLEEILATHNPAPLTPQQEQAIEDILKDAREYYRKKNMITDEEWTQYQKDLSSDNYPYA
jgi:trimethylamine--corrinoid protein Co-methyltransferase